MSNTTNRFLMAAAGAGGAETKYVENNFATQLYTGTGAAQSIVSGVDLSTDGGLVISKIRDDTDSWVWGSPTPPSLGTGRWIQSNGIGQRQNNAQSYTAFNDDGYSIGTFSSLNQNGRDIVSHSFRKAPGFLDIVEFVGDGSSSRNIAHNLGSVPGWIVVMCTTKSENKTTWHKEFEPTYYNFIDADVAIRNSSNAYPQQPTNTQFTIGNYINISGETYVAWIFGGGASPAATARSVDLDGSGDYFTTSTSSDYAFGTGDFTVEHWIKINGSTSGQPTLLDARTTGSYTTQWVNYINTDNTYNFYADGVNRLVSTPLAIGTWNHVALVRYSGTTTLYLNGTSQGSYSASNNYSNQSIVIGCNAVNFGHQTDGQFSNLRIVKGTALYTSSFKAPTQPLANVTNTKLLCFNNSSTTGTTVGTITASGNPTASTDSPFDDPSGFVFGEAEDQPLIKCGSYIGNGSTTGPEVNIGWEPQWILIKNASAGGYGWFVYDSMRGWFDNANASGNDRYMMLNSSNSEATFDPGHPTSTGFLLTTNHNSFNTNGSQYIYIAIRRPDPLVGKPPKVGTDVFDIKAAQTGGSTPYYQGYNFVVDSIINKNPDGNGDFAIYQRLAGQLRLKINEGNAMGNNNNALWDYMNGFNAYTGNDGYYLGWGWKRGAGFDVVTFKGVQDGKLFRHNLGRVPEMMWFKCRTANQAWQVYHKGLNGGVNPEQWNIILGSSYSPYGAGAENNSTVAWNNTAPTAETFSSGGMNSTGHHTGEWYIVQLFASVDGISKVGYYDGSSSTITITTGFTPRFLIIKRTTGSGGWYMLDATRGWGAGNDNYLSLNLNVQQTGYDFGAPTSSGFTLTSGEATINNTGEKYIYYAHA